MFVIQSTSDDGIVEFYDGSNFTTEKLSAYVVKSLADARQLQGSFQALRTNCEVTKLPANVAVTF